MEENKREKGMREQEFYEVTGAALEEREGEEERMQAEK